MSEPAGSGDQINPLASQPTAGLTQQDFHVVSELVTKCHNYTQCCTFTLKRCVIIVFITVNNAAV